MDKLYDSKTRLYSRLDSKESYKVFSPPRSISRNRYNCTNARCCFSNLSFRGASFIEKSYPTNRRENYLQKLLSNSIFPLSEHKRYKKKKKLKDSSAKPSRETSIKKNYESFGVKINKCKLMNGRTANSSEKLLKKELHIYMKAIPHENIFTRSVGVNTEQATTNKLNDTDCNKVMSSFVEENKYGGETIKRKFWPFNQRLKVKGSCKNLQKRKGINKYSIKQATTLLSLNTSKHFISNNKYFPKLIYLQ